MSISLADLSLREKERGFVVGGVDSGKSTLCDMLGAEFLDRYAKRGARRLILDSKPRYRAELTAQGVSAARRYKSWSHGPVVPHSVVIEHPSELEMAWRTGARTVIVQTGRQADLGRLVAVAGMFIEQSRSNRPQLLQVDETMDFFYGNGGTRGADDAIVRAARAGRERGTAALYGSQRTKQIPATLMGEMSKCYCLRIDYVNDVKRLPEMGMPAFTMPTVPHQFVYWTKADYRRVWGPYKLELAK